ncbi:MAG: hypothetical protein ACOCQD_04045 [archaeon]
MSMKKLINQLKMLKHRPRLFWHRLYIRKNEFHKSLNTDPAIFDMNTKDRNNYIIDLIRRRDIAHNRDLNNK